MKIHLLPEFRGQDEGDGGIRRIVEAQRLYMPDYGFEFVKDVEDADIVASHAGINPDVPPSVPWIAHTHGLYWQEYDWARWCHMLNRQVATAARKADHVTVPSQWVADVFRRTMWVEPTILYHGIDPDEWKPSASPSDFILWNKTRVDPVCDPTPVNQVASRLPQNHFITTFGNEASNVRVIGRQPYEVGAEFVKSAGVYLCTTRETFGIGTIEAMAAGVPVVGWAWGGQTEIITHGVDGWLCNPGDYDGLAEGILWALKNRDTIGELARNRVLNNFTWEMIINRYADLYRSVYEAQAELYAGPRVSVVVPCYNLGQYLPDTLNSLRNQTMENWEAIIVDDASPDHTKEVVEEFQEVDSRIRYVRNDTNLYLAGALNEGIQASSGRYVMPLDADNMIAPTTLEDLANALDDSRNVDIAYGSCMFVEEDGRTPDATVAPDGISRWPQSFIYSQQIQHFNQIPSTSLYRRKVWQRSGGYRTRCRTAEDAEFWTRVTSLGFSADKVTNRVTLIYRQRQDSMSRVNEDWDWTAWFPWSRESGLTPFAVADDCPNRINEGLCWNVSSYEPVRVTVIIPVGPGHEKYLIDALDSVQAQTFQNWECIVINDTGQPLGFVPSWVKYINTSGERGPAHCRNLALMHSQAPLFVPLDADDYLQPDALSLMLEAYNQFGGVIYSQWWDEFANSNAQVYDPPEFEPTLLMGGAIHAITALYPKTAWVEVGGFDEAMGHWEDWDFHIQLAMNGYCSTKVPVPLFTYRKDTGFRRESNLATRDEGKGEVLNKWNARGIRRESIAMACSGCPKGGGGTYQQNAPPQQNMNAVQRAAIPTQGYASVRYMGRSSTTITYTGKQSGTKYRFGNNPGHQVKIVFEKDLPSLLELRDGGQPLFEVMEVGDPQAHVTSPQIVATQVTQPIVVIDNQSPPIGVPNEIRDDGAKLQRLNEGGVERQPQPTTPSSPTVNDMTIAQAKDGIDGYSLEDVALMLSSERAGQNRTGMISLLTNALTEKAANG